MSEKHLFGGFDAPHEIEENRLAIALSAIWDKIQDLKQYEYMERKDAATSPEYSVYELSECGDAAYHAIRCQLLRLQLEYCRYLILKKFPRRYKNTATNTDAIPIVNHKLPRSQMLDDDLDKIPTKLQTSDNCIPKDFCEKCNQVSFEDLSKAQKKEKVQQNKSELRVIETSLSPFTKKKEVEKPTKQDTPKVFSKCQSKNQHPSKHRHSHLKLKDVPFLLGTVRNNCSVNPSHSVIACVQTIISALKNHNVRCQTSVTKNVETSESQQNLDVLKNLGKDFNEISQKHEKLKKLSNSCPNRKDIQQQCKDTFEILQEKAKHIIYWNSQIQSDEMMKSRSKSLPRWKSSGNVRICN